jgi:hypothetical protein
MLVVAQHALEILRTIISRNVEFRPLILVKVIFLRSLILLSFPAYFTLLFILHKDEASSFLTLEF